MIWRAWGLPQLRHRAKPAVMEAVPCSNWDLALPGGVSPAVWQLLHSCKPRARLCASVMLKSKTLNRRFGHKSWTLRRTLPLTSECLRIWWEAFIIDTRWWSERDVFSTVSWALDNTEKTSKEAQLIHLFLANRYLDMHQRGGLGSQETQRIKKCCDGLEARLHFK